MERCGFFEQNLDALEKFKAIHEEAIKCKGAHCSRCNSGVLGKANCARLQNRQWSFPL